MDVVSVTSPVGFWRAFLKLKVGGDSRRHLGCRSIPDNRKWAKRRDVGGAGCWNHAPSMRERGDRSGSPPVTQVATPLIYRLDLPGEKIGHLKKKIILLNHKNSSCTSYVMLRNFALSRRKSHAWLVLSLCSPVQKGRVGRKTSKSSVIVVLPFLVKDFLCTFTL